MTFSSVNRKGKKPRENLSISIARRKRCCCGVNMGTSSVIFGMELPRGVARESEPAARIDCRWIHGLFESTLSVRSRWKFYYKMDIEWNYFELNWIDFELNWIGLMALKAKPMKLFTITLLGAKVNSFVDEPAGADACGCLFLLIFGIVVSPRTIFTIPRISTMELMHY